MPITTSRPSAPPPAIVAGNPAATLAGCIPLEVAAEAYRVSRITVWRWTNRGVLDREGVRRRLPTFRVGRRFYIRETDLAEFLAATS